MSLTPRIRPATWTCPPRCWPMSLPAVVVAPRASSGRAARLRSGGLDELLSGYDDARRRATTCGFTAVRRIAGGRAAAYHRGSVLLELFVPQDDIVTGTEERFEHVTALLLQTLLALGVDAAIGELPDEYCPGRFTIHADGIKLAGVAQRSIRGASMVSAFVSVQDGAALRRALVPVYEALSLPMDPHTAGAIEDVRPGLTASDLVRALVEAMEGER